MDRDEGRRRLEGEIDALERRRAIARKKACEHYRKFFSEEQERRLAELKNKLHPKFGL